ncbi:YjbH domain-containing protein [Trinickia acidisoli]|uniref:YjbH domain-containing protein n=1 Tax=Trinickia acidisoli TaxID=2767482 RepID=UPI001F5D73BD|nr:YjbH domain-containing protein [Trinickia acidisoli]
MWQSRQEVYAQEQQRQRLISEIGALRGMDDPQREGMIALISSRAATGRVVVEHSDPRWLQANPARDPLLERGDKVIIPTRPSSVTVIRADGSMCTRPHVPNAEALDYVLACDPRGHPDFAWIAQPDGRAERVGVALWNRSAQDLPAPGAWIWAPGRGGAWPQEVSGHIANFFATQGVSDSESAGRVSDIPLQPDSRLPAPVIESRSRDLQMTSDDWGGIGLLQMPTARMADAGEASISLSNVTPYTRLNVMLQPLDWFELVFGYTNVTNQAYGSASLSGTQTYKDKSIDAKFRLWKESAWLPEVSVGFRDLGGTSLFGGEYVVGSKRAGDFDWTLGLGWGYLGGRGNLPNPLSVFGSSFNQRQESTGTGQFSLGSYFHGRTSLFGGVQYQTPIDKLLLKVEYDGNNYQHEPFGMALRDRWPINVGAVYRASKHVDLTLGYERGSRLMFGVAIHGNLKDASMPKLGDPLPLPVSVPPADTQWQRPSSTSSDAPASAFAADSAPASSVVAANATQTAAKPVGPKPLFAARWVRLAADIEQQTGWRVIGVHGLGADLLVEIDNPNAFYVRAHLERVANVLDRDTPPDIRTFHILPMRWGMPVADYVVERSVWVDNHVRAVPPSERASAIVAHPPISERAIDALPMLFEQPPQRFKIAVGPGYQQTLGGPNGFVLYQLSANASAELRLTQDAWIGGDLNVGLINNYDKFTYDAPSSLPHVRTDIRQYVTSSRVTIPYLQLTKVGKIGVSNYYSLYGGLLESMFAGVGGEWLYRPPQSRLAVGVDVNAVRQRGFRQDFSLLDYSTVTGNVTLYWDTGWHGVHMDLSVGRYLARDRGATLDLSRTFRNGVTMGAYATRTNVSSAEFGEGSFDKGIYVTIPFDAMMTRSSADVARLDWHPLTRDGGAKLDRQYPLYDLTRLDDWRSLWYRPPSDDGQ